MLNKLLEPYRMLSVSAYTLNEEEHLGKASGQNYDPRNMPISIASQPES